MLQSREVLKHVGVFEQADIEHRIHADEESMPASVQELERQVGVRLVVADRTDPEEVGYVQWRTAFYVAGRPSDLSATHGDVLINVCISFCTARRLEELLALAG